MIVAPCDGCGDDVIEGIPHDCPVLGTIVEVKAIMDTPVPNRRDDVILGMLASAKATLDAVMSMLGPQAEPPAGDPSTCAHQNTIRALTFGEDESVAPTFCQDCGATVG